LTYLSGPGRQW